jgi:hypothetical protein
VFGESSLGVGLGVSEVDLVGVAELHALELQACMQVYGLALTVADLHANHHSVLQSAQDFRLWGV